MQAQTQPKSITDFLARCIRGWDRFWFKPADPTTLGLIRILGGMVVVYIHLAYTYDLQSFFGPNAWYDLKAANEFRFDSPNYLPPSGWEVPELKNQTNEEMAYRQRWGLTTQQLESKGQYRWSIWYHVTDPTWMRVTHICFIAAMVFFTIGFCTRITGVITWIAVLSYIHRAPTILFGVDTMMNLCVLYLVIGPSGAALSVDRLLRRWWATRHALQNNLPVPVFGPPAPQVSANFAIRLMQVNACAIYFVAGLSKVQGSQWQGGVAVWSTMANWEFSPMQATIYMEFLRFLSAHRWLWEVVITFLSYGTFLFEISFAFLIWIRPVRWPVIIAAVLFHLGIAICMGLVTFSMMMLVLVLSFVPPATVRQLLDRLAPRTAALQLGALGANGHVVEAGSTVANSIPASSRI